MPCRQLLRHLGFRLLPMLINVFDVKQIQIQQPFQMMPRAFILNTVHSLPAPRRHLANLRGVINLLYVQSLIMVAALQTNAGIRASLTIVPQDM